MVNRGDLTESRFVRRATGRALRLTQSAAGRTAKRPETDDSVQDLHFSAAVFQAHLRCLG